MIPVTPQPPPPDFDFEGMVATPGRNALLELSGEPNALPRQGRPHKTLYPSIEEIPGNALPSHWRKALPALRQVYGSICAYLGLRIHPATGAAEVDHFRPKSKYQRDAYQWENFRLSCKRANIHKDDHEDVLDPFTIAHDFFSLNLFSGEVEVGLGVTDPVVRKQVEDTIKRLHLNEDPIFVSARKDYIDRHFGIGNPADLMFQPPMDFESLMFEAPFVAAEINRQGKKRG